MCIRDRFGTACMGAVKYVPENMKVELSLKVPGNNAVNYKLHPCSSLGKTFPQKY